MWQDEKWLLWALSSHDFLSFLNGFSEHLSSSLFCLCDKIHCCMLWKILCFVFLRLTGLIIDVMHWPWMEQFKNRKETNLNDPGTLTALETIANRHSLAGQKVTYFSYFRISNYNEALKAAATKWKLKWSFSSIWSTRTDVTEGVEQLAAFPSGLPNIISIVQTGMRETHKLPQCGVSIQKFHISPAGDREVSGISECCHGNEVCCCQAL